MIATALKYSVLWFAIAIVAVPLGFAAWIGPAIIGF
jgi:hypothetical protein